MLNTKWDRRFLEMAKLVSGWSQDPSTKTGAVLVTPDRRIISVGYNGFAQGVHDTEERYRERKKYKYRMTIHCEDNAVIFADRILLKGSCLYTWPFLPCSRCSAKMIQCGIKRVVSKEYLKLEEPDREDWASEIELGSAQFNEAGVEIVVYPDRMFYDPKDLGDP